jgi:hypothetical protein
VFCVNRVAQADGGEGGSLLAEGCFLRA